MLGSFQTANKNTTGATKPIALPVPLGRYRVAAVSSASQVLTHSLCLFSATPCPPLRPPERGSMRCLHTMDMHPSQSSCSFSCEEGSVLVGPELVQCTASGVWTAPPPMCRGELRAAGHIQCPPHPVPAGSMGDPGWLRRSGPAWPQPDCPSTSPSARGYS